VSFSRETIEAGLSHLRAADPTISRVIDIVGPFALRLERDRLQMLVRSILWQQISFHAARSIHQRLLEALGPGKLTAEKLLDLPPQQYRRAGVSPQKTGYLLDLAAKLAEGRINLTKLAKRPEQEIIDRLTEVKGIGVWTAQMFLIFSLGRLDVFPFADLGIRVALRKLYRLEELPDRETSLRLAEPWRPYSTIAAWYCWRSLERK